MSNWKQTLNNRFIQPIIELLKQGVTPEKMTLTITFGILLGTFPILGSTTLLCTIAVFLLRLNLPAIQLVNFLVYPLQIALMVVFFQAGNILWGTGEMAFSMEAALTLVRNDFWQAIQMLWRAMLGAVFVWGMVAPIAGTIIYFTIRPIVAKLLFGSKDGPSPPPT